MRAMVSEALPGVTPEMSLTVLLGKLWASAAPVPTARAAAHRQKPFISLSMVFLPSRIQTFGSPSRAASQSAVRLR